MLNNSSKLLFIFTLILSTMISISSTSWLGAWMGLEINLLSFIPLMINTKNLMSTEASLKYFLTQALASSILIFIILIYTIKFNFIYQFPNLLDYESLMICSTLLLKSGAAPFHFWFPSVMGGISWYNNLILMTWQKIAPIMLLSYCMSNNLIVFSSLFSIILGSLGGLNQISLRKIMAFSSINHLGWMIASMLFNESLWIFYFLIYSFLSFNIIFLFNAFQLFYMNQMFLMFNESFILKFIFMISILSLGGLPPFLGFLPKWLIIQSLNSMNYYFLLFSMIIMTMITLFFYLRLTFSAFMLNYPQMSWNYKFNYKNLINYFALSMTFISISGMFLISLIMAPY
uniref:NADH-ubiquinone oxidoreductase chain 2 n=1 Tax=Cramptonomyia spenceri TaxID=209689 RepID=G8J8D8_9DIPT|nr:NADH dehydrogenase subunit 2 [Cramptonomyia spenceri]AET13056.1 NADH dehydrogenase subunit 2 [Cramptonomyia spenceri]